GTTAYFSTSARCACSHGERRLRRVARSRRSAGAPRGFDGPLDVVAPEVALGEQLIVRGAKQASVLRRRWSPKCPGLLVVKLQKATARAAHALRRNVAALHAVALDDLAPHFVREAPTVRARLGLRPWAGGLRKAFARELVDQEV